MASGLLSTGISGLLTAQQQLNTTGHNIANVNTEGYSRQRVIQAPRDAQFTGAGFVGKGVETIGIERIYDEFLGAQVRSSTSAHSELETYHALAAQLDNFIADPNIDLSTSVQTFFNAINEVAGDPTSVAARQVALSNGETLVERFLTMNTRLENLNGEVNRNIRSVVDEINSISRSIADVNDNIVVALGQSGGTPPNDLLDRRDVLLTQLSERIDVATQEQEDGSLSVFIGNGQALVLGTGAGTLEARSSGDKPGKMEIFFSSNTNTVAITQNLNGGELNGALRFAEEILDPAQKAIGRIAAGLAIDFNQIHQAGYDLTGNNQVLFFENPSVTVIGDSTNTGTIAASFNDVNQLELSDYRIEYDGTNYTATRLSDNSQVYNNTLSTFVIDGVDIDASGAAAGDSYLIQPTHNIAGELAVAITNPSQIAASQGDTSTGAIGDNRNALTLAGLENNKNLQNGTANYQSAYGQAVAEVGTLTSAADINRGAQEGLLTQARQALDSKRGVNLDEEAANLIRFQQVYQASAQVISVTNTLFNTLINALGG